VAVNKYSVMGNGRSAILRRIRHDEDDWNISYVSLEKRKGLIGHYNSFKLIVRYRRFFWELSRRFKEVECLDKFLISRFPVMKNLWKPPKYFFNLSPEMESERGENIAEYLTILANIEILASSDVFRSFLEVDVCDFIIIK